MTLYQIRTFSEDKELRLYGSKYTQFALCYLKCFHFHYEQTNIFYTLFLAFKPHSLELMPLKPPGIILFQAVPRCFNFATYTAEILKVNIPTDVVIIILSAVSGAFGLGF